jgi:hypothetical protein
MTRNIRKTMPTNSAGQMHSPATYERFLSALKHTGRFNGPLAQYRVEYRTKEQRKRERSKMPKRDPAMAWAESLEDEIGGQSLFDYKVGNLPAPR